MDWTNFATYAVALAIAAIIPGPGVIALVANALGAGFRHTVPMLLGLTLGDVIYLAAAILGLAYLANTFGTAFVVIKYCGAAYLAWMAFKMWRAGITSKTVEANAGRNAIATFSAGLFVTLGNPKTIVFYLALLPNLMDLSLVTPPDFALLIALTFVVLVITMTPYIALAGKARSLLQTPRLLRLMNRIAATFLGSAAITIAARSH
ncbi:MAG: LysE family translocator [Pseudomonadota bacterium]